MHFAQLNRDPGCGSERSNQKFLDIYFTFFDGKTQLRNQSEHAFKLRVS